MAWLIPLLLAAAPILLGVLVYNNLIDRKNRVDQSWSDIDVQLKKRYDLLPNLIETVKAYMKHEKETLVELTELRTRGKSWSKLSDQEKIDLERNVNRVGRGMMFQMEAYPDLKASQNFLQLQSSWNEVEEQLSAARRTYNANVKDYNNGLEQFPSNIFARSLNYQAKPYIEIPEVERKNISAKELFNN